jgi:hypothetical protein
VQRPGRRAARSLCAVIGIRRYLSRAAYGTHAARLLRAARVAAVRFGARARPAAARARARGGSSRESKGIIPEQEASSQVRCSLTPPLEQP